MVIKSLQDIKDIVAEYLGIALLVGDRYFLIKKEFVNEVDGWLREYTKSKKGDWLEYELIEYKDEPRVSVLRLYI